MPQPNLTAATPADTKPSILIADDDSDLTSLLKSVLSGHFNCRIVHDGSAALRLVRESPPQLVLLDLNMPGMNGLQVLRILRGEPRLKHLPIILLTAEMGNDFIDAAGTLGATDYIIKPVQVRTVARRVREIYNASR